MFHHSEMKTMSQEAKLPNQKSNRLPDDSWSLIAEFAGLSAMTKIPLLCKDAKNAFQNNAAWKSYCLSHFPRETFPKTDEEKDVQWQFRFKELEEKYYPVNKRRRLLFRSVKEGNLSGIQELKPTLGELHAAEMRPRNTIMITPVTLANQLDHQDILSYFYHLARHRLAPSKSDKRGCDYISYLVMCDQADKLQKLLEVNDSLLLDRGLALFRLCIFLGCKNVFPVIARCFPDLPHNADSDGIFPLHIAAQFNYPQLVKRLLDYKVDVNQAAESNGATALILAAGNGDHDVVVLLLARNANVNQVTRAGFSALFMAVQNGHVESVKLLLAKNADVNITSMEGFSPLYVACQNGHYENAELLLKKDAEINHVIPGCGAFPLVAAVGNNHLRVAELLLTHGADVNQQRKDGLTSLYMAAQKGYLTIVELLVARKADVNRFLSAHQDSPIAVAGQNGYLGIVQILEKNGGNLHQAATDGFNAFVLAAQEGHFDVVEYLFSKGSDVNHRVKAGASSLFIASQNGHVKIVKFLLEKGADPFIFTHEGMSPLFIAETNGHREIVSLLKEVTKKREEVESKSTHKESGRMHLLISRIDNQSLETRLAQFRDLYADILFKGRLIGFDEEGNELASAFSDEAEHVLLMNCTFGELRSLAINISLHARIVKESELSKIKPLFASAYYKVNLESALKRDALKLEIKVEPIAEHSVLLKQ